LSRQATGAGCGDWRVRLLGFVSIAGILSGIACRRAEPGGEGGHSEIVLWHSSRGAEERALAKAVDLFTAKTGAKVELLALPNDSFADKLEAAIPHGHGPDVFVFPAHERLRLFLNQGLVAPVAVDTANYVANAADAVMVDGLSYGFPLSLKCVALYVNSQLVHRSLVTTDDWLATLRDTSRPSESRFGLVYESGEPYYHAPFLFGFGGELFDASGRARFDSPGMTASLAFVKRLQDEQWMPLEVSGALVKTLFNEGRAATAISGPWFAGEIAPSVSYRVVPLPRVASTELPMRPFLSVAVSAVSPRAHQPAAAESLARFLSLGEAAMVRSLEGREVPASRAVADASVIKTDPLLSAFGEAAQTAIPMPNTLEMTRTWEPLKRAIHGVLQGTVAPSDAGALAIRRYRALYRPTPAPASPWPYVGVAAILTALGTVKVLRGRSRNLARARYPELGRALAYVAPAAAGVLVLIVVPLSVGAGISLFHHEGGHYTFVGLANFVDILASKGYRITEPLSFYFALAVTVLWTVVNVALHVSVGLALALLLKNPLLRLRGVYRVLLIIPWAVPNYITALMWRGMFHQQFGAINGLLVALGLQPVSWFTHFTTAFAANVVTNTWLGFPFMMVVALGALQSIPQDLYEAAEVDGASNWVQFRRITLPLLRPALLPAVVLGLVWTFNMFNVIYLVSGGEPGGATDILVSEAFRWAFQRNEQYGYAAAYSVLIFFVLIAYSAATRRIAGEKPA
jgi:arabinogalactan oligomer / maltooligosaccharide transport system permease protein